MTPTRRHFLATAATAAIGSRLTADSPTGKANHTKFACNVEMWFSKEKNFLKRLEGAAALGFPGVEFWPYEGKDIAAVADTCERLKLTITQFTAWGFKPGMNDPKNKQKVVDKIGEACEVAKKLKCQMMCVVAGDDIPGVSQEQMHATIIDALKAAAPVAEAAGVMLILEAMNVRVDHKGHCLYGSAPAMKIVKAVGSKFVKLNWDLYHMHITEGDLCGHLKEGFAADAIGYVQLADHPGRHEPGTGEINYSRVLKELATLKYTGWVGTECTPAKDEATAAKAVFAADEW
ncbi:TIM barrel protein [Limnoglobus roseus]|uniref:Xylose isomerase n=1 Tax=Limnoglobus roseus TaxID=2598579 RepID=A0A5C1ACD0_9BACT|nr:TIM barrel protein [Limnoglobus roseus]QEL15853.1 xylose isomerase [Limnoglobus roseus]